MLSIKCVLLDYNTLFKYIYSCGLYCYYIIVYLFPLEFVLYCPLLFEVLTIPLFLWVEQFSLSQNTKMHLSNLWDFNSKVVT